MQPGGTNNPQQVNSGVSNAVQVGKAMPHLPSVLARRHASIACKMPHNRQSGGGSIAACLRTSTSVGMRSA